MIRHKRAVRLVIVFLACMTVSGCTGLPDRQQEVDRLEVELAAMPGVADVSTIYANDFTAGARFSITATMPRARADQIAAAARRLDDLKHDDFDGYSQTSKFIVGEQLTLEFGAVLNPDHVADRTRRLRQIDAAAPIAAIDWSGEDLALQGAPAVADSLAAVRTGLPPGPARVSVFPRDMSPVWTVDFPFTARQEKRIQQQLAGLPVDVRSVTVANGAATHLSVGVPAPGRAHRDLSTVIASVRPSARHPMMLEWDSPATEDAEREFAGTVHVSGCRYPRTAGEEDPRAYYTRQAVELQHRLREKFDACT